jgi:hypothetical protein
LNWHADWAWSLPLIVINVMIHVFSLGLITQMAQRVLSGIRGRRHFLTVSAFALSVIVTLVTLLHGFEAQVWAMAYWLLGALPDYSSAVLYSLNAMTSYGHTNLYLEPRWELMGALEALNGMLLFGLSTAFLFNMLRNVWVTYGIKKQRQP